MSARLAIAERKQPKRNVEGCGRMPFLETVVDDAWLPHRRLLASQLIPLLIWHRTHLDLALDSVKAVCSGADRRVVIFVGTFSSER